MNDDQIKILNLISTKKSVFITGPGGVGKSFLIKSIKSLLKKKLVCVTALTGCAAILIDGTTLHSWSGLSPDIMDQSVEFIINNMKYKPKQRWKKTQVLIIDEISMLSKDLFEKLNIIGQQIRKNNKPFGGIQIIVSGDFFQLPPIIKGNTIDSDKFCFCSSIWNDMFCNTTVELSKIMRQTDENFIKVLNKIRKGIIDKDVINMLESRVNLEYINDIIPTQLYSMRHEVENINKMHLVELDNIQVHKWSTEQLSGHHINKNQQSILIKQWENDCQCEQKMFLAIGAQVVLLHNAFQEEYNLINGSRGVVIDFNNDGDPIVQFINVTIEIPKHNWEFENHSYGLKYKIRQYPLKLAWALTIHKSQGMTLDCVIIDISNVFEEGQAYVALSRVKYLDGLFIKNMNPSKIKANQTVLEYYESIK